MMLILKIIIVILLVFIISMWGNVIIEHVKEGIEQKEFYEKGAYIYDIIDKAYSKADEITNSGNYSLVEESITISYDFNIAYDYMKNEEFHKDGYFKEITTSDSKSSNIDLNYVNYGVQTKDNTFLIQLNDSSYTNGSIAICNSNETMHSLLESYLKENLLEYKDFEIREEKIDENIYYIISKNRNTENSVYCDELWINKDNMHIFKSISEKIGCSKSEWKFIISEGNVRDEDVRVRFAGEDEKIKELDEFFEKINNGEFENNEEEVLKWCDSNFDSRIFFDNYVKPNKKIITRDDVMKIINEKYEIRLSYGYLFKGIVFDQNGDAYYAYSQDDANNKFVQTIFVSVFGDVTKTSDIDIDLKNGDLVIL